MPGTVRGAPGICLVRGESFRPQAAFYGVLPSGKHSWRAGLPQQHSVSKAPGTKVRTVSVTPAGAEQGPCHRPGAGRAVRDRAAVRVHLLAPRPVRPLRRLHPGGQGAGVLREFYIHLLVCGSMASAFLVAILRCWRPHSHFWRMVEDGCRRRRLCTNNLHRLCWVAR